MTDFQHPAEQGSTGEDFLGPRNLPFPMYQYSVFLNGGRDEQLVVRASTFSELLDGKRNINKVLEKVDTQNGTEKYNGHSNGQVVCDLHEAEIFTVKKDGPNRGKQFKSCTKCRKFLGFV